MGALMVVLRILLMALAALLFLGAVAGIAVIARLLYSLARESSTPEAMQRDPRLLFIQKLWLLVFFSALFAVILLSVLGRLPQS
jgi:hypothetical protein